ncbi:MAG: hypothetical protein WBF53_05290 [Litorimonas sp.]
MKPQAIETGVTVGSVVSRQDRIELMTVERIEDTVFGPVLTCCWFEESDALRFGAFPMRRLDLFPSPQRTEGLSRGMTVRLNSRGPEMRIVEPVSAMSGQPVLCEWTGPVGLARRRYFPPQGLLGTLDLQPFGHDLSGLSA